MALDVPICRVESLPNAVQVGFAVRCTRRHPAFRSERPSPDLLAAQYDDFHRIFKEFRCQGTLPAGISNFNFIFLQNHIPANLPCQSPIALATVAWQSRLV